MSPADASRPFDQLYAALETAILSRTLNPGDKLPPERTLGDTHGVSRPTVREALRALEQRGLIEIRQGAAGGAFVKAVGTGKLATTLADLLCQGGVSYRQLLEFRESIEISVVGYAAERAAPEDIRMLHARLAEGQALARAGRIKSPQFYLWEGGMHLAAARVAQNPLFEWFVGNVALENERVHDWTLLKRMWTYDRDLFERALRDWQEMVRAIEERASMSAQMVMRCHLGRSMRALRAVQEGE